MNDPRMALWLYLALVTMQLLFSKRWQRFYATIAEATSVKAESAAVSGGTQTL